MSEQEKELTLKRAGKNVLLYIFSGITGGPRTEVEWKVIDEYDETVKAFQEKYPNIKNNVDKSLMQLRR